MLLTKPTNQLLKPGLGAILDPANPINQLGVAGCWLFNEGGGLTANDISGNNIKFNLFGNCSWISSNKGVAINLTPSGSTYAISDANSSLKPITNATIGIWVNPNSLAAGTSGWNKALCFPYSAIGWSSPYFSYQIAAYNGGLITCGFSVITSDYTVGILSSSKAFPLNQWTFVVATFNHGIITLYVNGQVDSVKDVSATGTQILYTSRQQLVLGTDAEYFVSESWSGLVDSPFIFNFTASPDQIKELYEKPYSFLLQPRLQSNYQVVSNIPLALTGSSLSQSFANVQESISRKLYSLPISQSTAKVAESVQQNKYSQTESQSEFTGNGKISKSLHSEIFSTSECAGNTSINRSLQSKIICQSEALGNISVQTLTNFQLLSFRRYSSQYFVQGGYSEDSGQ